MRLCCHSHSSGFGGGHWDRVRAGSGGGGVWRDEGGVRGEGGSGGRGEGARHYQRC